MFNTAAMRIVNATFDSNTATEQGGAIFFSCNNFQYDFSQCSLNISNSLFVNNVANQQGGAIKWNFYEPRMVNLTFRDNQAGVYGGNIASVAKRMIVLSEEDEQQGSYGLNRLLL